jgi:hypothetical protein
MRLVSHTFDSPLAAIEGVARDKTARYIAAVLPVGIRVKVTFKIPTDARGWKQVIPGRRYAHLVAELQKRRKKTYYVGK